MTTTKRRRATVIIEIAHEGQTGILVHADGHFWSLPGGGAEPGEPRLIAAIRELREETGLEAYAALYLFQHQSQFNDQKIFLLRASGQPRIVDPHEAPAFGLCNPLTLHVAPLLASPGFMMAGLTLYESAAAIIQRYHDLHEQHSGLFRGLEAMTIGDDGNLSIRA